MKGENVFNLFGFGNIGNYEARKVSKDVFDWGFISTARVTDGEKPYETAVEHKSYNGGDMVIVESYDTKEEAEDGHKKWVKTMTSENLPESLIDCMNSEVSRFAVSLGAEKEFKKS